MRLLFLPAMLMLLCCPCFAQEAYNIQLKISGLKDTTAYLGYFINESTVIKDTARVNGKGECAFTGKKPLMQGVYMFVLKSASQFEFLVGVDQHFTLSTSIEDPVMKMKVSGDEDNALFFENIFFNVERNKEAGPFVAVLKDSTTGEGARTIARENMNRINDKVIAFQENLIRENPSSLTARITKANRPIQVPPAPVRADGAIDSTFQLKWYRAHFFDNFDLSDDALLRLSRPLYRDKIYEYLDRLFVQHPDTLTRAIGHIVDLARKNPETYKYSVFLCMRKYQTHEIMGLDEVYVNLFDTYFATGEMDFWVNDRTMKLFKNEADRFRKSLIGRLGANLIMQDANLKPQALHDISNRYSILYIFDPDCPGCKQETPKLVAFYNSRKFDCEVFAVCSDSSMVKMRKYIQDMDLKWITVNGPRSYIGSYQDHYDAMSTPTLYVLDRNKKIIAKKIPAEKLEDFLTQFERVERLRKMRDN
jgi:hypothetical protein